MKSLKSPLPPKSPLPLGKVGFGKKYYFVGFRRCETGKFSLVHYPFGIIIRITEKNRVTQHLPDNHFRRTQNFK